MTAAAASAPSSSPSWWRRCMRRTEEHEEEAARILPTPPEAPSRRRRVSKKKALLSLIACSVWVAMGGLVGLLGPAIPAIAKNLGVEDTELGWAFSVRAGGYIIGSLVTSRLPERGPSKVMVMAAAAVVASAVNLAIPHSSAMLLFLALCFFQGIGLSIISTLGNIVLLEYWGAQAGPWLQGLHFCFGIGAILSSLILGVFGLGTAFYTFAAVGMVPMLAVLAVEGCPRWLKRLLGGGSKTPTASAAAEDRRLSGGGIQKVDDPRKVSSANLLSFPLEGDRERDEKEGPADADGRPQPRHAKRLSVSILPFQETVLPVPVNQEDGGMDIEALLSSSPHANTTPTSDHSLDDSLMDASSSVAIATDLNMNGSGHGGGAAVAGTGAPLPDSIKWLLTVFLGLYVGGECGFGGWISSFVLMEGATQSEAKAAFLVSIFWAAVTIGRAVAVGQAMVVGPSWSLRLQLSISLAGALAFLALGAGSFRGAAIAAAVYGYGMSSIYPLGMSWPGEAGFSMDAATTATLVIGGCVGEAVVPLIIGGVMHWLSPAILPLAILSVVAVLAVTLGTVEGLGRAALSHSSRHINNKSDRDEVIDLEGSVKVAEERQSRAPTAAGLEAEAAADVPPRVSFVLDKALDGSGEAGGGKGYHHRLSLSGGKGGFTLARASAAVLEGGKNPPKKGVVIGGGEDSGGPVVVRTTYGT